MKTDGEILAKLVEVLATVRHWRNTGMNPRLFPDELIEEAIALSQERTSPTPKGE